MGWSFDDGRYHLALEDTGDQPGAEGGGQQRTGCECGPEGFMHQHGVDPTQSDTTGRFRQGDAEGAEFGQLAPCVAVEASRLGELAHGVSGEPVEAEATDHLLQFALVLRRIEIHGSTLPGKAEHALSDDVLLDL